MFEPLTSRRKSIASVSVTLAKFTAGRTLSSCARVWALAAFFAAKHSPHNINNTNTAAPSTVRRTIVASHLVSVQWMLTREHDTKSTGQAIYLFQLNRLFPSRSVPPPDQSASPYRDQTYAPAAAAPGPSRSASPCMDQTYGRSAAPAPAGTQSSDPADWRPLPPR